MRITLFSLLLLCFLNSALAQTRFSQGTVSGNVQTVGNTISTTNTNGDLTLDMNGTGRVLFTDLTATTVPYLDGSKKLQSSSVTPTELGYLSGVSGGLQSQLNLKAPLASPTFTGTITTPLTASRALVTGASSELAVSGTTSTEIGFVSGVSSFLCGRSDTCTLSNKTLQSPVISGANFNFGTATNSNRLVLPTETTANLNGLTNTTGLIAYDTTQLKPVYNNGSGWIAVGSGSGGEKNYISNPDFENGLTGWTTYADAAATTPVDCTGGSPAGVWSSSTGTELSGNKTLRWAKSANNRQGEGIAYAFTIDNADKAKVMQIEFDYAPQSANFVAGSPGVDSDIEVFVYDVTNAVLIQPTTYKLFSSAISPPAHFVSNFQTASNSNSYRLCLHVTTSSTNTNEAVFDSFKLAPSRYTYGTPITDWQSYTPTITGLGTPSNLDFRWRRVGSNLEISGKFTSGTATGVEAQVTLPSGLTTSSSIPSSTITGNFIIGSNSASYLVTHAKPSVTYFNFGVQSSGGTGTTAALGTSLFNSAVYSLSVSVPIQGWSSTVQMSDSADQRVVALNVSASTNGSMGTLTSSYSDITWDTKNTDTHGAFGTTTYTIPVSGYYDIFAQVNEGSTSGAGSKLARILVNGVSVAEFQRYDPTNGNFHVPVQQKSLFLKAGDAIKIQASSNTTGANFQASSSFFSLNKITGPSSIGATESIAFRANSTAGQSITNTNTTTIVFGTETDDTHQAYNPSTGEFTAPQARRYHFDSCVQNTSTGSGTRLITLYKNGSEIARGSRLTGANTIFGYCVSDTLKLNAGDIITVRFENNSGATATNQTGAGEVYFSGFAVGL